MRDLGKHAPKSLQKVNRVMPPKEAPDRGKLVGSILFTLGKPRMHASPGMVSITLN